MRGVVIIPTYNERENLPAITEGIWRAVPELDILVVDDNSPDGTAAVAEDIAARVPNKLLLLRRERKEGLGRAYVHAFQYVLTLDYDFVVHMDADLSHDPAALPAMVAALENADLVLGSRYLRGISVVGWDFRRLLISKFATWYVRTITGIRLSDATSGYRCWRTSALRQLGLSELSAQGYLILVEMAYWAFRKNFRIAEVPIIFYERRFGASKIDPAIIRESALGVLALRWRFAQRKTQDRAAAAVRHD
jgi:dolichol-phosphate mannosyltransferase